MPKVNRDFTPNEKNVAKAFHPKHLAKLKASKLTEETIKLSQAYTEWDTFQLRKLLHGSPAEGPALVLPGFDRDGNRNGHDMVRLFPPMRRHDGKIAKYLAPTGSRPRPYFPPLPAMRKALSCPGTLILITEGILKALLTTQHGFATISLSGMQGWRDTAVKPSVLTADLAEIAGSHPFLLVPDADPVRKPGIHNGTVELARALYDPGAILYIGQLPLFATEAGEYVKCALDDLTEEELTFWVHEQLQETSCRTLNDWRAQMLEERLSTLKRPGLYLDRSPTGTGKSYADIQMLRRVGKRRSLTLLPTHVNCNQAVCEASAHRVQCIAFPRFSENSCYKYDEAFKIMNQGLTFQKILCPECEHQGECDYYNGLLEASNANHAIATHKRGEITMAELSQERDYITIHESLLTMVRPQIQATKGFLPVALLAKNTGNRLTWKKVKSDEHLFYITMEKIARELHGIVENVNENETLELFPPSRIIPNDFDRQLWRTMNDFGIYPPGDALRLVIAIARGKVDRLIAMVDELPRENGEVKLRRAIVGRCRTELPKDACVWINDATANREDVEAAIGTSVEDRTPAGSIKPRWPIMQIPRDVTLRTEPSRVADILRGILYDLPYQRVGVITHQQLEDKLVKLLGAPFAERIARIEHFRGGYARGANSWLETCDCLIVLGTPRVPPHAVRFHLLTLDKLLAAQLCKKAAGWTSDWWSGVTESGKRVTIKTKHYIDHDWHAAHHALVVSEIIQSVGRARSLLDSGIPCYLVTTENLAPLDKGIDGRFGYPIADRPFAPLMDAQSKVLQAMEGLPPMSACAIATKMQLSSHAVRKRLLELSEAGRIIKIGAKKGCRWGMPR